jgi:hypothetical protein
MIHRALQRAQEEYQQRLDLQREEFDEFIVDKEAEIKQVQHYRNDQMCLTKFEDMVALIIVFGFFNF